MSALRGLIDRDMLEARERRELAPWGMTSHNSLGREHPEPEHAYRTVYQRDRDRIIHSTAFRRLEYKTQVFANYEGDYYRTRLTHTMEVAQIARSVARALGLNEDLTETLALAHDLGHGPFGHSGEDALNELMRDHGGFEHNAHGLRIVERLECRYPSFQGLNLTYEARESMVKHGLATDHVVPERFRPADGPLLECQVADICDAIAYNNHDLDDGLTAEILTEKDARSVELVDLAFAEADQHHPNTRGQVRIYHAIVHLINRAVTELIEATLARLDDAKIGSVADVRSTRDPLVGFSAEMARQQQELHTFLLEKFYRHYRVVRMQNKAKRLLTGMFAEYVHNPGALAPDVRERAEEFGIQRAVCDLMAGMTDREAQSEHLRLFHPYERA
jgi:dGTPase